MRTHLVLISALAASCSPAPMGEALLTISATPHDINDVGETADIRVVATDASGKVGAGPATLSSSAGSFKTEQVVMLDEFGTYRASFACAVALDPYCKGEVDVTVSWVNNGKTLRASTVVKVTPPPHPWELDVVWDPTSSLTSCAGTSSPAPMPCSNGMCQHGFACVDGNCVLNGGGGGFQYTLRLGQKVDLDLHVVEPIADGGICEVYFGQSNTVGNPTTCGAVSSLDLDSHAGCAPADVDVENIIFPRTNTKPLSGTYIARVDLYAACMATTPITYELQVRAGSISRFYCGQFLPTEADGAGPGGGRTVSVITLP